MATTVVLGFATLYHIYGPEVAFAMTFALITTILSCAVFSCGYLYFLGLRIVRAGFDEKQSAFFLGLIVGSGILTATVTGEAVLLLKIAREISGQLFLWPLRSVLLPWQ